VISALMRNPPDAKVVDWLDLQPSTSIWTSSVTVLEVRFGLEIMPAGKRQASLIQTFEMILEKIDHRVAPFNFVAAQEAASLMAQRQKRGRPGELRDTMIAGIVLAHRASLATGNTAHFLDFAAKVINPWIA
jgi:predicted nucleic acid-binding protein